MRTVIVVLGVILLLWPVCSFAGDYSGGGDGSAEHPFKIKTAADMNEIGNNSGDWDKNFILVKDINIADYTGTQFNIIGTDYYTPFTGVFDGNGHTISNFTYDSNNTDCIGLFGFVGGGAKISNIAMENVSVNGRDGRIIGGLAGVNNGIILNCCIAGTISGDRGIGGLVGIHVYGTILNCSVKGRVSGNAYFVGGLVGWNDAVILNSYAECIVSGDIGIGGLVGMHSSGTISNCYSTGTIKGDSAIGGLIGEGDWGAVFNCYATTIVVGSTDLGALIGYSLDTFFSDCFWDKDLNPSIGGAGDIVDPNGTIAETTENMKKQRTFTNASWDFVGEIINGIEDIWEICEGVDYPRFARENINPVVEAGPNQVVYAWIDGMADVILDGNDSNDADGDELSYYWSWIVDNDVNHANGVSPAIELPVGEYVIELIVNDGHCSSESDYVDVNVIGPVQVDMIFTPKVINKKGPGHLRALLTLPDSIQIDDVNDQPFLLCPTYSDYCTEASEQNIYLDDDGRVRCRALLDKEALLEIINEDGTVELNVAGRLTNGQHFYGTDSVKIK